MHAGISRASSAMAMDLLIDFKVAFFFMRIALYLSS
jgi:hypothetical protein